MPSGCLVVPVSVQKCDVEKSDTCTVPRQVVEENAGLSSSSPVHEARAGSACLSLGMLEPITTRLRHLTRRVVEMRDADCDGLDALALRGGQGAEPTQLLEGPLRKTQRPAPL